MVVGRVREKTAEISGGEDRKAAIIHDWRTTPSRKTVPFLEMII